MGRWEARKVARRALVGMLLACWPGLCFAAGYLSGTHVEAVKGTLELARHWDVVLDQSFESDLAPWQTENYENNINLERSTDQPHSGAQCLVLTHRQGTDTAWELRSPRVPCKPGQAFWVRLWTRSSRSYANVSGHKDLYWQRVEWLDGAGSMVGSLPISLGAGGEQWGERSVVGQAPAGAVSVCVRLGFDAPNIGPGDYLALDDLQLLTRGDQSGYESPGEMLSRPLAMAVGGARSLRWTASGAVRFQLRAADDDRGGPGTWSEFAGPSGPGSWFTKPVTTLPAAIRGKAWVQYKAELSSASRRDTPVLKAVWFGEGKAAVLDAQWTGPDDARAELVSYGPTRTAETQPLLAFTVVDPGAGLDPRSVALTLDGKPLALTARGGGRFEAALSEPLSPPALLPGFRNWRVRNHASNLQVQTREPRVAGGGAALRFTRPGAEVDTAFVLASPDIAVAPGATYRLSYWLRSDLNLKGVDHRYGEGLRWFDGEGKQVGETLPLDYGTATAEWSEVTREVTAPAGAVYAIVTFGWDTPNISGGHYVDFADVDLAGPHPPLPNAPNLHYLQVAAADYAGNRLQADWYLLVKPAPDAGVVTVRPDGVTLVDGKPFFPIGIYSVSKRPANNNSFDDALAELKAAGFNLVHTYSTARNSDFRELYDAARKHGMMMFVAPESGNNNPDAAAALYTVVRECNEPTLLSWYLADDTAGWIGVEELTRVHQAIRDVDPYHLTVQADGARSYPNYVNATVAFLPEIYPIREKDGNHVADVIRDMKTVQQAWKLAGHKTPVWAIIQNFEGWGWKRFPTDEEERCMVYLAVIHGAQGMTWYTYTYRDDKHGAPWDPQKWAYLKRIAGELSALSDVLTSPAAPTQATGQVTAGPAQGDLDYPSLNLRTFVWQGKHYLLAANSAPAPITATITAPGLKAKAEVLFEDRQLAGVGGKLTDQFAPLAVHVYCW